MNIYLDASVLVSMFVEDANTPRAWRLVELHPSVICSLWTIAEFSSALGLQFRMGRLASEERLQAEARLDRWVGGGSEPVVPSPEDFLTARRLLRESAANLRTPDALHLAVSRRIGAPLASFDARMIRAAEAAGISAVDA